MPTTGYAKFPTNTPWGKAHVVTVIAPGIVSCTTASHGGIWLSPSRFAVVKPEWQKTFAGGPWFEEDCDWAKVALTFPEYFAHCQDAAKRTMEWLGNTKTA